ncbi:MAG: hypothetical protein ACREF3_05300 [Acetobacteraceae bacterium]
MSPHDFRRIALAHELLPAPALDAERGASARQEESVAARTDTPAIPEPHDRAA